MPTLTDEEIHDRISYHQPTAEGAKRHLRLSAMFEETMAECRSLCPTGRELALVYTKLEEAKMWASAAVARIPETR